MRIKNTIINSLYAILSYVILAVLGFCVRKVFLETMSIEMLGYEGLFGNVFAVLALADLGLENLILYRMFSAYSNNNTNDISKLMSIYRLLYKYIGITVLALGIAVIPFLRIIIKDNTLSWSSIIIIYLMQLVGTLSTYFLAYKRLMYAVSLREYECIKIDTFVSLGVNVLRIVVLIVFKNYYLYLLCSLISNYLANIIISRKVDRDFKFLEFNRKISREDIKELGIGKEIKNNMFQKVSGTVYGATDNILITYFLGIGVVGFVGNYNLISGHVTTLMTKILSPFSMSIGNYVHSEDISDGEKMFRMFDFLSFYIACIITACYLMLFNPFIELVFGKKYILSIWYVVFFVANQYIHWNHQFLCQFRYAFGRYELDKWPVFIAMIVNIVASIILCQYMGVAGIMLGTVLGHMGFWIGRVRVMYTEYLREPVYKYIVRQIIRLGIWLLLMVLVYAIGNNFSVSIISIIVRLLIAIVIPSIVISVLYIRTQEMRDVIGYMRLSLGIIRNPKE